MDPHTENFNLYKGVDFEIEFRIFDEDGAVIDTTDYEITFKAAAKSGDATLVFDLSTTTTPLQVTVDNTNNFLNKIAIGYALTADITETGTLYYEIDAKSLEDEKTRSMVGRITLIESN